MSDDPHIRENNHAKPLEIPKKAPPKLCARQLGFSVRDCRCMLRDGGFAPCPAEAIGILEPIEEFRARLTAAGFEWRDNSARASEVAIAARTIVDNNGFARSALQIVKATVTGPGSITDLELPPTTPAQISAAVAAERATLPLVHPATVTPEQRSAVARALATVAPPKPAPLGGKEAGFTGSICGHCGSTRMIRNGVCETCIDCYQSGECA